MIGDTTEGAVLSPGWAFLLAFMCTMFLAATTKTGLFETVVALGLVAVLRGAQLVRGSQPPFLEHPHLCSQVPPF